MRWKAVFWDFDGVILDSVNVKTEAFAQMFKQYGPEAEKAVVNYHLAHGGVSRYEKFRYYYEKILGFPITEDEVTHLGKVFSQLVLQKVIDSPYVPGAKDALELLKKEKVPCFVVSGTPEDEMNHIIDAKPLRIFFEEVHGAPRTKTIILKDVLARQKYHPKDCLYLGDAMTDYEAAISVGVFFHGIVSGDKDSPFPNNVRIAPKIFL